MFEPRQKQYLQGFAMGSDVARAVRGLPVLSGLAAGGGETATQLQLSAGGATVDGAAVPAAPERIHFEAQQRFLAAGQQLSAEEKAKRKTNPLDAWEALSARAEAGQWPKGTDVFLTKFHGLFYVAPAQNAYMCRLRIPGGVLSTAQARGIAELADRYAGGYADVTTRANLQLREIGPGDGVALLEGLRDLGLINLGAGGDNVRNVTSSPLSGIDPEELIETLPWARRLHHWILNHRELYGLPRKFNIAFDGGGRISALEDTNDIGFTAVRVPEWAADDALPAGVYFLLTLGGITGHQDFARSTGVLVRPEEAIGVAHAILRVFIAHGDRTDRKKARLKYLLDAWGFDRFLEAVEQERGTPLRRVDAARWERPDAEDRLAHVGVHPQRQPGLVYVGILAPVGRLSSDQLRGLAALSDRHGDGQLRLTVWQNLLISGVPREEVATVQREVEALGLDWQATPLRAGLVACTGSAGCKYAGADTKRHALQLAEYLQGRVVLDQPLNIHLTGCHHSCAQHYIGDIGLQATRVPQGEDVVDGYHLYVGGGWASRQRVARLLVSSVVAEELGPRIHGLIQGYLDDRQPDEPFVDFVARSSDEQLKEYLCGMAARG